ncbi:hypothetical protein PWO95_02055 [Weissella paramesenteroides]|uniref:hypothetical protein n=1 Tax=Weissella paramesenteroides TaxID=1249 RepID=UPI0023A92B21|nr:hypothetical protein [Weissella paramesenteroides]WEA53362.1 hypothetical protein PWO95_02055 [Weissella paramesenteroides]
MGDFFKKYKSICLIILLFILIGIPLLVQLHVGFIYEFAKEMTPGNHSNWMDYWGNVIGSAIGVLGAFFVAEMTFKNQSLKENKQIAVDMNSKIQNFIDHTYSDIQRKVGTEDIEEQEILNLYHEYNEIVTLARQTIIINNILDKDKLNKDNGNEIKQGIHAFSKEVSQGNKQGVNSDKFFVILLKMLFTCTGLQKKLTDYIIN